MNLVSELGLVLEALLFLGLEALDQVLLLDVLEAPELGPQLRDLLHELVLRAGRQLLQFQLLAQADALLSQRYEVSENSLALILPAAWLDAHGMQVAQVHLAVCRLLEVLEEPVLAGRLLLLVEEAAAFLRVGEMQACLQEGVHICCQVSPFTRNELG